MTAAQDQVPHPGRVIFELIPHGPPTARLRHRERPLPFPGSAGRPLVSYESNTVGVDRNELVPRVEVGRVSSRWWWSWHGGAEEEGSGAEVVVTTRSALVASNYSSAIRLKSPATLVRHNRR